MKLTDLKFTPGPWYAVEYGHAFADECYWILQKEPNHNSRSGLDLMDGTLGNTDAGNNGFLASKAPDLLAELVEARDVMQAFDMKSDKVNETLDKINKLLES